ncbi:TauD/TfdA family dioxygenase [Xanthomonas arboricola]|uniref:TauD/TfdA family dioxygenase n=1 Tax=Xanthomonas arboricola TaxID=56448 RepID=UPI0009B72055|nr:TauD/TfdA family dioxygenase [Xanthomonas arboricola]MDN0207952.1 TauD/TfdA family dioxygenase [Xanthomonas arboricola pv. corylina]MDN0212422.1 TauD/TfdA family dioxygenase [Xanthomonas arboricola pv. corylina]
MTQDPLPFTVMAPTRGDALSAYLAAHGAELEPRLVRAGAVLYRGFAPISGEELDALVRSLSSAPYRNDEESSPRNHVHGNVYTSTNYRSEMDIFPHNENSYKQELPTRLFFYCVHPGSEGGATPIVDCRKVLERIDPSVRLRFEERRWMYVRNYTAGIGIPWQEAFNTRSRDDVESYCRGQDIQFEWVGEESLKTWQIRDPLLTHPVTGEVAWFNHATFFNIETLDEDLRASLRDMFGDDGLPHNTYYGDGSPIEPEVIRMLQRAYLAEAVPVNWQTGDLLVVDNLITAHARKPFKGERRIYLAQADPVHRDQLGHVTVTTRQRENSIIAIDG